MNQMLSTTHLAAMLALVNEHGADKVAGAIQRLESSHAQVQAFAILMMAEDRAAQSWMKGRPAQVAAWACEPRTVANPFAR